MTLGGPVGDRKLSLVTTEILDLNFRFTLQPFFDL
jgi:hypothetical protein